MKSKETVSTLNAIELPGRQCGNTTRQVNYAVDMMFLGYRVKVEEHASHKMEMQDAKRLNQDLMDMILKRLYNEHRREGMKIEYGKLKINSSKLIIELEQVWEYRTQWEGIVFGESVIYETRSSKYERWITGSAPAQPWMKDQMNKGLLRIRIN